MKQQPLGLLPHQVIKDLAAHNPNYVVYEKLGHDGRIHRNFITLDKPYFNESVFGKYKKPRPKSVARHAGAAVMK